MMKRRICVVTGSRSDYGLLYWPMRLLVEDPEFEVKIIVTGMHLSTAFGETWKQIENDGFTIEAKIDSLVAGDTAVSVTKSVGLGVIGFADTIERLKPDLMLVLGDRFEILAAVQAALFAKVPVAHFCGGDVTEGAVDDSIRHCITKLSHVHFPSNTDSAKRLLAMGENPDHIHTIGSPGIDLIRRMPAMDREKLFSELAFEPRQKNLLVVFHPATLENIDPMLQLSELLLALNNVGPQIGIVITGSNADTNGQRINDCLLSFADSRENTVFRMSLGSDLFINALRYFDVIVGNSSSGLYEAPSLGTPTVNIGDRQKGRLRSASVIDCQAKHQEILDSIEKAMIQGRRPTLNPYGDGYAAEAAVTILRSIPNFSDLLSKKFFISAG